MASPSNHLDRAAVVGLGYVGLPLAVALAEAGYRVTGIDVDARKVAAIAAGKSVSPDVAAGVVSDLVRAERLVATADFAAIRDVGLVSICVPTPLRKSKDPDLSHVLEACASIVPHVTRETVVVLESTTYPGTTRELIVPSFEEGGLVVGRDVFLAFSPERIDPGNRDWTIHNTPKVIGGITAECGRRAHAAYSRALDKVVLVSNAETAEMCKLLENTFRSVNIGLVNELAMVCHRLGLSAFEVIEAASSKPFGFMPFRPGPGLGGHCLPIDPLYLSWKMRTLDFKVRFIDLADDINSSMPGWIIQRAADLLNDRSKPIRGSAVLIVGMAYKGDVDDVRESPAVDLFAGFRLRGADVSYFDPHVPEFVHEGDSMESVSFEQALAGAWDLIVIATDHANVDHAAFADRGIPVLDTRNALSGREEPHVHGL